MSDPIRIAIIGATGLIGRSLIERAVGCADVRILAIARREMKLPKGATMEMVIAEPDGWGKVLEKVRPQILVNALGTTMKKAGSQEAFRSVDYDLVMQSAQMARGAGISHFISVSAVGADPFSKNFYLKVKGEAERDLGKIGFNRLDIFRPGLLRGRRDDDPRFAERAGIMLAPVFNLLLHGKYRKYRAISAGQIADAALALALHKRGGREMGRFIHEYDALLRAQGSLPPLHNSERRP